MKKIRDCATKEAFLGGNQQEKLLELIETTTTIITNTVENFANDAEAAMNITLNKYGDIASEVAGKFTAN